MIYQKLIAEFFLDFLYFPIWWYTKGAIKAFRVYKDALVHVNFRFAPGLWLKNLFTPMYGQRDWEGRLVSIFIRFVNIVFRSLILVFFWAIFTLLMIGYFLLLPLVVFFVISSRIVA